MHHLTRDDLMSLEDYAQRRAAFRGEVMAHKKNRQVALGEHLTLYFEDRLTIQYQVQEMLRAERIFERDGIQEELDAYNPLIPDGSNLKATLMIEYPDAGERQRELARLVGIEDGVWVQVGDRERAYAIADEDMERDTVEKTSAVHFLRFELDAPMVAALEEGAALHMGVEHENYRAEVRPLPAAIRESLSRDLD